MPVLKNIFKNDFNIDHFQSVFFILLTLIKFGILIIQKIFLIEQRVRKYGKLGKVLRKIS